MFNIGNEPPRMILARMFLGFAIAFGAGLMLSGSYNQKSDRELRMKEDVVRDMERQASTQETKPPPP
uniref:Uncharacterized protein n=1 Tax=Amphimedon queenslandica TaxID=400682 RepID=A0A1X7UYA3_AMPQE